MNAGTSGAAVLNFTIPAGATGATGQAGATGPAGTTTWAGITDKPSTFTPASHTHGNITNAGAIGSTSGQIVVTGTGGTLTTAATINSGQVDSLVGGAYLSFGTLTDALQELDSQIEAINYILKPIATSGSASDLTAGTVPIARIPTGTTSSTVCIGNDSRLSDARTPTSHAHGNLTNAGAIGTASGQIVVTTTGGVLTTAATISASSVSGLAASATTDATNATNITSGTFGIARIPTGTTSTTVCVGNDSRLSDTRTPTDGSVTDSKIASAGLSTSSLNWAAIQAWAPSTAYAKGDLVEYLGVAYRRSSAGTSGATFNTSNWQQITPTSFVASQIASGTVATDRLGSGTASNSTFLRGDQAYASVSAVYEFTRSSRPSDATGSGGSYSWTIPANARIVEFFAIGAGGGGGSGRRGAAGSARFGGGGGGSGGVLLFTRTVAELATRSISVVVGAGGGGGASVTTDDTNGNNGSTATDTSIAISSQTLYASRGSAGSGGSPTSGSGGSGGNALYNGNAGANSSATATPSGTNINATAGFTAAGGGAGGGISTGNVSYGGSLARAQGWNAGGFNTNANGGTAPGGNGQNAADVFTAAFSGQPGGSGGGGAAGDSSSAGGSGGSGANYGGGGGGGGASFNGRNSGAGGNGGDGYVRITVWY